MSETATAREVTMHDRMIVAAQADALYDLGPKYRDDVDRLINAVRCCGEFPECTHVLDVLTAQETA